jgi:hypothetical protein
MRERFRQRNQRLSMPSSNSEKVISELKRENQFLSKRDMGVYRIVQERERERDL